MSKVEFTNLEEAYRFYMEQSMQGKAATLETVVPCERWLVVVFS